MLVGATLIAAGVMNVIRNKEYTKYDQLEKLHDNSFNTIISYDEINGNIQEIKNPNGSKYAYEYDDYGRLKEFKGYNFLWNKSNLLEEVSNDDVYCIFDYDTNGRRIRKKNVLESKKYIRRKRVQTL